MPFSLRKLTRLQFIAVCFVVVSALTALGVNRRLPANIIVTTPPIPVLQDNPKKSTLEVEILTLRENGFEPKAITRPKGAFRLALNNQSQLREELTFSMLEEKGKKLKDEKLHGGGKHRSDTLYDLTPGKYQIIVNEHPEWICSFEITPK